jgi:hypothetical protein
LNSAIVRPFLANLGTGQRSLDSRCSLPSVSRPGRSTLTHTSWTEPTFGSRKWMSGQAAALAALNDRWLFANLTASSPLREPSLLSARRPPSLLDFYLSWMSPGFSAGWRLLVASCVRGGSTGNSGGGSEAGTWFISQSVAMRVVGDNIGILR